MKCANHPQSEAIRACIGCTKPLCAECGDAEGRCAVCAAQAAAEDIQRDDRERVAALSARVARRKRMARLQKAAVWSLFLLSAAAVIWQLPAAVHYRQESKPLRIGTYATDAHADACIANLWIVSRTLQEGNPGGEALSCPASLLAYLRLQRPGDAGYRCPEPGRHGLKSLEVSHLKPVPEARK